MILGTGRHYLQGKLCLNQGIKTISRDIRPELHEL